jgi:hypothetical protein
VEELSSVKSSQKLLPPNPHRICQMRKDGRFNIREYFTPFNEKTKKGAHVTLKCGCCDEKVIIYFSQDGIDINGVSGSLNNWKELFKKIFELSKLDDKEIIW